MFFTTSLYNLQLQLNISHDKCGKESGRLYKAGLRNHVVMTEATQWRVLGHTTVTGEVPRREGRGAVMGVIIKMLQGVGEKWVGVRFWGKRGTILAMGKQRKLRGQAE